MKYHGTTVFILIIIFAMHKTQAYTTISSNISTNTVWTTGTYYVSTSIDINSGITLTVNSGVVVKFAHGARLFVPGTLDANGSDLSSNTVVFTSIDDNSYGETISGSDGSPSAGDWGGIQGYGVAGAPGQIYLDYTIIRYGGNGTENANVYWNKGGGNVSNSKCELSSGYGIRGLDVSLTVNDNEISNNSSVGVYLYEQSASTNSGIYNNNFTNNGSYAANIQISRFAIISGNSGSGNGINGFGISGTMQNDQTWSGFTGNFPVILLGYVEIDIGYTLTIPASTIIKAESNGELVADGIIDVNGGSSTAVVFTSIKDDNWGGDTNGDGSASSPAPGDWKGIYVTNEGNFSHPTGGKGYFDYCIIQYGGNSSTGYTANLGFNNSVHTGIINNCVIQYSANRGLYIIDAAAKVRNSRIVDNNTDGIYGTHSVNPFGLDLGTTGDNGNNRITGNSSKAIYNNSGTTIYAESNYWGVTTESEINAMITNISGSVDFNPWLTSDPTTSPLPVELTTFTAKVNKDKVLLNWSTATEVNNYGFEVEKQTLLPDMQETEQNTEWQTVGFVPGNGNSNSPKSYSFTDNVTTDKKDKNYVIRYRLKQIDTDGSFEYFGTIAEVNFGITAIEEDVFPESYSLSQNYPNPFNPVTTINYSIPTRSTEYYSVLQKVKLSVYDMLGNEVATLIEGYQPPGSYSVEFNCSNLSSGTYIYRIQSGNFTAAKKLILIK